MPTFDPVMDHRARLERARFEAEERRERALIDQRSPDHSSEMRVRAWERLHDVRLPKDPAHPILAHVSKQTGLAMAEVREVQRQRTQPPVLPAT